MYIHLTGCLAPRHDQALGSLPAPGEEARVGTCRGPGTWDPTFRVTRVLVTGGGPDVGLPHLGSNTASIVTEQPGVAGLFLWDPVTQVGDLGSQESSSWVSRGPSGTWLWVRIPLTTISIRRRSPTPLP